MINIKITCDECGAVSDEITPLDIQRTVIGTIAGTGFYHDEKTDSELCASCAKNPAKGPGTNTGHGHVWQRPDGVKARCGGPGLCITCSVDKAKYHG